MKQPRLYSRRNFVQGATGLVAATTSLNMLTACSGFGGLSASPASESGVLSATVSNMPLESDAAGLKQFKDTVALFEKSHPQQMIIGRTYKFDPATYYARFAAGQAEDAVMTYFTEPQIMIARRYAADITNHIKGWQHFASFDPDILQVVTGQDGQIYGVPVSGYALCLLYSRSLFQQAGLDPDKPPTTWDEFRGYAKQIAGKGVAGYAEVSTKYGGGWHFTNWMNTAGGELEVKEGDKWRAVYNSDKGVAVLNMLKAMCFTDKSMTQQQLLDGDSILPLIASKKVAMLVTSPSRLADLKVQYQADLNDLGLAPMPQNGGNAALSGGSIWIFNPKSKPDVVKLAYDWTIFSRFDLKVLEDKYAIQAKSNQPVGLPTNIIFRGEFQKQLDDLVRKYANVPLQNYQPFVQSKLRLKAEPPIETQKMYSSIDPVVQAVLTVPSSDPKKLLDTAATQFQAQVLDKLQQS